MGRLRNGRCEALEEEADRILKESLEGVTSRADKSDILTPWKEKHRKSHEIMSRTGHPIDGSLRRGMYNRAYNRVQTHLNSYDGPTRPIKMDARWDLEEGAPIDTISPGMAQVFGTEVE